MDDLPAVERTDSNPERPSMFLIDRLTSKMKMPTAQTVLPGRPEPLPTAETHFVNGRAIAAPVPNGLEEIYFWYGMLFGCGTPVLGTARRLGYRGWIPGGNDS